MSAFETWLPFRQLYLDELLLHERDTEAEVREGHSVCQDCHCFLIDAGHEVEYYRCLDCINIPTFCKHCARTRHEWNPFHRIQVSACAIVYITRPNLELSNGLVRFGANPLCTVWV
jgi:hypothetical protein